MSGYVGVPIDRNFLLLSAIYAIHCVLLHVFLQPIDVASVTIDKNYLIKMNIIDNNTNNYHNIKIIDNTYQIDINSSDSKSTIIDENIVLAHQQTKKAAIKFLSTTNMPESSFINLHKYTKIMINIMKNISPATWGIISGCVVFLLTFTDNVH